MLEITPVLADSYESVGTSLVAKSAQYPVEIGDTKQTTFYPQVKIPVWDNDGNFSLRLLDDDADVPQVSCDGNVVVWKKSRITAKLYDQGFDENTGGFEFEVWLIERPDTNVLRFSMQAKNLTFHYQAPLKNIDEKTGDTWELNASGLPNKRRPANVNGSYAVYHATQAGDYSALGGKNYKAGKAFHLFRPWAQDVNGVRVWCDLIVDEANGLLTITLPQDFLDAAVYPVLVDPTFGYTTHGGSSDDNGQVPCYFWAHTTPASSGTLTDMVCYCHSTGAATNFDAAIYTNVSGVATAKLAAVEPGGAVGAGGALAEITTTGFSQAITSGVQYWLGAHGHNATSFSYAFDALHDNASKGFQYNGSGTVFPATALNGGQFDEQATIWGIYTASGGSISGTLTATLGALTPAATGTVSISASSATTLGALTDTGTGTVAIAATTATTLGTLTDTGTGTVSISASSAVTLGALTDVATSTVLISASCAVTLGALLDTANGTVLVSGALSQTLGALTVTGLGTTTNLVSGTLTQTLGALMGTATVSVAVVASAASTLGSLSSAASVAVLVNAVAADVLSALTLIATGGSPEVPTDTFGDTTVSMAPYAYTQSLSAVSREVSIGAFDYTVEKS